MNSLFQVRRHNHGPKVESAKRSVERAREQLYGKRRRKLQAIKKLVIAQKWIKSGSRLDLSGASGGNNNTVDIKDSSSTDEKISISAVYVNNKCDLKNGIKNESIKEESVKMETSLLSDIKSGNKNAAVQSEFDLKNELKNETEMEDTSLSESKITSLLKDVQEGSPFVEPVSKPVAKPVSQPVVESITKSGVEPVLMPNLATENETRDPKCEIKNIPGTRTISKDALPNEHENDSPEPRKDTLNEILEILNDLSKNSSHSYQMMCSQLLSEYLTGQNPAELATCQSSGPAVEVAASPGKTISSYTVPIQEIPVASPPSLTGSVSSSSTTSLTSPVTSFSTTSPTIASSSDPDIKLVSIAPKINPVSRAPLMRPFIKPSPPPNVTISYNKEPKSAVNPDLRPVINIPSLDTSPSVTPQIEPVVSLSNPRPAVTMTAPQSPMTQQAVTSPKIMTSSTHGIPTQTNNTTHHVSGSAGARGSPELPSRTEFNILSDMTSLESLLDILKENSPIQDFTGMRCTCKTMLRCNLHDIGYVYRF